MNKHRSRPYLAYSCPSKARCEDQSSSDDGTADLEPEYAAEYIAELLGSLRDIAVKARLPMLSDLLYVAEEEAKLHLPRVRAQKV